MHYKQKFGGSITVYLSLVLLLVTAILCTVVESARIQGAKNLGQSMLQASVDSLYSSYQRELFDSYGIFAYSCKEENCSVEEQLKTGIKENFEETQETENWIEERIGYNDVFSNVFQYMEPYELELDQIKIEDAAMLTDYEGELFLNQVYAYMKYSAPANLIKDTLERWNLYDSTEETSKVMKKKLETQEALGELSKLMLQLIEEVEGIDTDENGVRFNKSGVLKTKDSYAKKIITQVPTMQTLGINKELVFCSLKGKYYNIAQNLDLQISYSKDAIACNKKIEELEKALSELEADRSELESVIASKEQEESKEEEKEEGEAEEAQDTVSEEETQLAHIEEEISSKKEELKKQEDKKEESIKEKKLLQKEMLQKISDTIAQIEKAQKTINKIESKSAELGSKVDEYEQVIEAEKTELTTENYEEFQSSKNQMREYLGQQNNPDTISTTSAILMRKQLQHNQDVLEKIYTKIDQEQKKDTASLEQDINRLQQCKEYCTSYTVSNLQFDYSSLQVEEDVESPVESVGSLLESGLLTLVVEDSSTISEQTIDKANLPSTTACIKEDEQEADCKQIMEECEYNEYSSQVTDSFSTDHSAATNLAEKLLLNQYQMDFFKNYVQTVQERESNKGKNSDKEGNQIETKNTAASSTATDKEGSADVTGKLAYEQEYILAGHSCDKDNLSSVVTKIVMMRTVLNFLYLFTDKDKNALAYATATSLVGFTCLPPLITLVKVIILFAWAMVEALVDTYALLAGYSVPIFKTKATFQVGYTELLTMSKAKIGALAKNYEKTASKIGNLSYEQYIRIFLLLNEKKKNCYRTMDLIQVNMQEILGDTFQLEHCLFGMKAHATMYIPEKFITFPFIKDILGTTAGGYVIETTISNGY